jgi:hypothetical protein
VDASTTRSEAAMTSSSVPNGTGDFSVARNVSAASRRRVVAATRTMPVMPESIARHTARPITPSPTTPTRSAGRVFGAALMAA